MDTFAQKGVSHCGGMLGDKTLQPALVDSNKSPAVALATQLIVVKPSRAKLCCCYHVINPRHCLGATMVGGNGVYSGLPRGLGRKSFDNRDNNKKAPL